MKNKETSYWTKAELETSGVVFREEDHTYWLGDKQLQGVTGMIHRQLFPDKYKGVAKDVLQKRADFGHKFHKDMEFYINTKLIPDGSEMFRVFYEHYGDINFIASEYIVTDGENFASPIDAIDRLGIIYDFKTSTNKDVEYWKWQLSVYCYLFKLQNGFAPNGCKVLWINKDFKHELIDIVPYDMDIVEKLLEAEVSGTQFVMEQDNSIVSTEQLSALEVFETEIVAAETKLKAMKEGYDNLKKSILATFIEKGVKSWETDKLKFTVKDSYKRSTVDSKALKEKYPDIYNETLKESTVAASLIVKVKDM